MSLERFLRLHPVLKFGNFSTRVHPSCEGLGRPPLRNQHQCGAEPVDPAWQSHALSEGALKARSSVASSETGVLSFLGLETRLGEMYQAHITKAEARAQPTSLLGVSQNCLPQP